MLHCIYNILYTVNYQCYFDIDIESMSCIKIFMTAILHTMVSISYD